MGSPAMETDPMITIRMAITIATMGRLMKNLDIKLFPAHFRRRCVRLRAHGHSGTHLLYAFRHHALSRFYSLVDNPQRANPIAGFHVADFDFVIARDHRNLICALQFGNSALWY